MDDLGLIWNLESGKNQRLDLIPCLHKVVNAHQKRTSGTVTIFMENLTATENYNAPQLIPPQDLDPEAL